MATASSSSLSAHQQRELDDALLNKVRNRAFASRAEFQDDISWARSMLESGFQYMSKYRGGNDFMFRAAIMFFEMAKDKSAPSTSTGHLWVKAQLNIGSAQSRRATLDQCFSFDDSIASFSSALRYADKYSMFLEWVKLNLCLGRAYLGQARHVFDRAAPVERARKCFGSIITEIAPDVQDPMLLRLRTAAVRELGKALSVGNPSPEDVRFVVAKWQEALNNTPPDSEHAVERARMLFSLGRALSHPAVKDFHSSQDRAIGCFQQARRNLNPSLHAPEWIRTNTFLCSLHAQRINGDRARNIELAILYGTDALDAVQKARVTDESLVGDAYQALGNAIEDRTYGSRLESMSEAVTCFRNAVEARVPGSLLWAASNASLAGALCSPLLSDDSDAAYEGLACYEKALDVFSPETTPQVWVSTSTNYALSLRTISFRRGGDSEMLTQAVSIFKQILQTAEVHSSWDHQAVLHHNLSLTLFELNGTSSETSESAASAYAACRRYSEETLKVWGIEWHPLRYLESLRQLLRVTVAAEGFQESQGIFQRIERAFANAYAISGPGMASSRALSAETSIANRLMFAKSIESGKLWYAVELCDSAKALLLHSMIKSSVLKEAVRSSVESDSSAVRNFHTAREAMLAARERARDNAGNISSDENALHNEEYEESKEVIGAFISNTLSSRVNSVSEPLMESTLSEEGIREFLAWSDAVALHFFYAPTMEQIRQGRLDDSLHLLLVLADTTAVVRHENIKDPSRNPDLHDLFGGPPLVSETESVRMNRNEREAAFLESIGLLIDEGVAALRALKSDLRVPSKLLVLPHRGLHKVPLLAVQVRDPSTHLASGERLYLGQAFTGGVWVCPSLSIAKALIARGRTNFSSVTECSTVTVEGPGTVETRAIHEKLQEGKYFPTQATLLEGHSATKESLISSESVKDCDALNVIAHGNFGRSGSALAAADDREAHIEYTGFDLVQDSVHGSFFSLTDIWTLSLKRCGLACVVACFAGTVDSVSGDDESLSIGTAFLVAGAQFVVCSLWPVHKAVAAVIVDRFWSNIGTMRQDPSSRLCISTCLLEAVNWFRTLDPEQYLRVVEEITDDEYELKELPSNTDATHWAAFQVFGAAESTHQWIAGSTTIQSPE